MRINEREELSPSLLYYYRTDSKIDRLIIYAINRGVITA